MIRARCANLDVMVDPRERADLKARHPEVFARLKNEFASWNATMLPYPADSSSEITKQGYADRY